MAITDWQMLDNRPDLFTYSTPADVLTVDIPCACGTQIHLQLVLPAIATTMPCPGCGKSYKLEPPRIAPKFKPQAGK